MVGFHVLIFSENPDIRWHQ